MKAATRNVSTSFLLQEQLASKKLRLPIALDQPDMSQLSDALIMLQPSLIALLSTP